MHRDIKDANLFITEDKKTILVNDWGSAVSISAHQSKFSGTVVGGSDNLLNSLLHNLPPPKYSYDLHALARTIFCKIYRIPPGDLPADTDAPDFSTKSLCVY